MRRPLIGVIALLILIASAVVAYASIPGPDGVIHGCYKTSNPATGSIIVVDSEANCPSGFAPLNWNQTGPQGPAGPAGPQGPAGPASYQFKVEVSDPVNLPPGTNTVTEFGCSGLDSVVRDISAGFQGGAQVTGSVLPVGDANGLVRAWRFQLYNGMGVEANVRMYVVCAEPVA